MKGYSFPRGALHLSAMYTTILDCNWLNLLAKFVQKILRVLKIGQNCGPLSYLAWSSEGSVSFEEKEGENKLGASVSVLLIFQVNF